MTDPNGVKTFISRKDGKMYTHYARHKANERQVDLKKWKNKFIERKGRTPTSDEIQIFKTGYNMGYKEGNKRGKTLKA